MKYTPKQLLHRAAASADALYVRFQRCAETRPLLTPTVLALSLNLIIEILGRRSLLAALSYLVLHPYVFFINALILLITLLPAVLFSRRTFVYLCVTVGWLALGITNFVLLGMRNTPLAAIDFGLIVSCIGIIDVYLNPLQMLLIGGGIAVVILGLICLYRRTEKQPISLSSRIRRITTLTVSVVSFVLILGFSLHIQAFTTKFPDLAAAYTDYGFAYCFSLSVLDRGVDRPTDYSDASIDEILDRIDTAAPADTETDIIESPTPPECTAEPNIIFVQLESFFDVKRLAGITFSEDPTPVFTALKESCPSGYLSVPSIGAGTANTEFEVLSGMNLDDFGAGEYPYKTVLRTETCESIAYNLRARDYTAHALHNNSGTFYERHEVYSMLGFDTFVPLEHMKNVSYNPLGWAKDATLTAEIRTCLDSTPGRDFVFAVSVQPHGKYPDDPIMDTAADAYDLPAIIDRLFDRDDSDTAAQDTDTMARIRVRGIDDAALTAQYTYYVNQLYETDMFLGALIADLSASEEETVLVLYGDHLPCFDYTADDLADGSTPYQTEYVIWSSFGITAEDRDLYAYQLTAHVQSCIGMEEGILTRLHQSYLSSDTPDAVHDDYLTALQMLEYDMLYGDREAWDGMSPHLPTDLQYGIHSPLIYGIHTVGTSLYITGEHFTPYSRVLIGSFQTETVYVDEHTLMLPDATPDDGDPIAVIQTGADGIPLGKSNIYVFDEPS